MTVAGIISSLKQLTTKKGDPMVFLRLDDVTGGAEVVVFSSVYAPSRELLEVDRIVVVKGRVDHKQEGEMKLLALEVDRVRGGRGAQGGAAQGRRAPRKAGVVRELAALVGEFPGEAPVDRRRSRRRTGPRRSQFGPEYRVAPEPDFFAEVKALLGEAAIA